MPTLGVSASCRPRTEAGTPSSDEHTLRDATRAELRIAFFEEHEERVLDAAQCLDVAQARTNALEGDALQHRDDSGIGPLVALCVDVLPANRHDARAAEAAARSRDGVFETELESLHANRRRGLIRALDAAFARRSCHRVPHGALERRRGELPLHEDVRDAARERLCLERRVRAANEHDDRTGAASGDGLGEPRAASAAEQRVDQIDVVLVALERPLRELVAALPLDA